jgi:hypothetical protein
MECGMATEINTNGSGNGASVFLSFLVGAALVAVAVVGFFMWDNYKSGGAKAPAAISLTVKEKH